MSPTTTRAARGWAARYAAVTETIAWMVRWLPYSRLGMFGTPSVSGSHVTQFGPSMGSCVPSTRLPLHGSPTDVARCQSIFGIAAARAALEWRFALGASAGATGVSYAAPQRAGRSVGSSV